IKGLKLVARTLKVVEDKASASKTGGIFIQLSQAGAAFTVFSLSDSRTGTASAVAILVGPALLSKALTTPAVARWLSIGMRSKLGSEASIKNTALFSAWLLKEGGTEQKFEAPDIED
ncbi:hypothetical protein LCGC14_2887630, partial [marine sediment metagenome]